MAYYEYAKAQQSYEHAKQWAYPDFINIIICFIYSRVCSYVAVFVLRTHGEYVVF